MQKKICSKCLIEKSLCEFSKHKGRKDGLSTWCKKCNALHCALYRKEYPEKFKNSLHQWYVKNSDKAKEATYLWKKNNQGKVRLISKKASKKWAKNNPDKVRVIWRRAGNKKRSTPQGKLRSNIVNFINYSLKGNKYGCHWETLVNFTLQQLKQHLESQFRDGMSWKNYGKEGWEIDHIIPLAAHNYEKPEDIDFKRAWSLSNLQPLWGIENQRKNAKLEVPFQPALLLTI